MSQALSAYGRLNINFPHGYLPKIAIEAIYYIDLLKCTYPGMGACPGLWYTTLMIRGGTYLLGDGDTKVLLDA